MELILKETIDSLGREGDVVKVKPGYARNYLLPKGKAVAANEENLAVLEKNKAEEAFPGFEEIRPRVFSGASSLTESTRPSAK